jgi:response regulator RpfG family c-di-GMP phosphodiesterase
MPTVLCLDDLTRGLAEAARVFRASGYRVLTTDDNATALNLAIETRLDAVLLNCRRDRDNTRLVAALRILQPHTAVLMFSGHCGVPCDQLHLADACLQKGGKPSTLLSLLQAVLCQSRYGLCRSVKGL